MATFTQVFLAAIFVSHVLAGVLVKDPGSHAVDYYAHPKYAFKYGVSDPHTGDVKSQQETRDGDVVRGQYSLVEPDGTVRTVDYVADPVNGFNAVVSKSAPSLHIPPVKHVQAVPATTFVKEVAPVVKYVKPLVSKTILAQPAVNTVYTSSIGSALRSPSYYDYDVYGYSGYDLDSLYDIPSNHHYH